MPCKADLADVDEERFGHVFAHLPVALWQYDHTALARRFAHLRQQGVVDLDLHIARNPDILDTALEMIRLEAANARATAMLGGASIWTQATPALRRSLCALFAGEASHTDAMEIIDQTGRAIPVEITLTVPLPLPSGRHIHVIGLTPQVAATSEERYHEVFRNVPVPLVHLNMAGVFRLLADLRREHGGNLARYIENEPGFPARFAGAITLREGNVAAAALFGLPSPADFPTSIAAAWTISPETLRRSCLARIGGAQGYAEETKIRTFDGRIVDVMFSITFATGACDPQTNVVAFVDVSDRVRAQAALLALQTDFAHASRLSLMGELAGSIAHEVNQPLTGIIATAQMIQRALDRAKDPADEIRELATDIVEDGHRAAAIIANIRGMVAKKEPRRERACMNAILRDAIHVLSRELQSAGVALSFNQDEHLPPVLVDCIQIQQVIVNLALNAIQAIDLARSFTRWIRIDCEPAGPAHIRVTVADSGPGIPPELIDRIFGSFMTTRPEGLGIGLSICRSIVETHGGRLTAASTPQGAAFSFTLPSADEPAGGQP